MLEDQNLTEVDGPNASNNGKKEYSAEIVNRVRLDIVSVREIKTVVI